MKLTPTPHGQLLVWTDIDPADEDDFNLWYNREHMEERARIPGMPWARRYRARGAGRRYLAIYRTDSLATFTSDAYRAAFGQQTDWSNRNFARMTNTQRRVLAVSHEAGMGAGGGVSLIELAEGAGADIAPALSGMMERAELMRMQLLLPDAQLSTPLPSEPTEGRVLRPLLLIDTTSGAEADSFGVECAAALGDQAHSVQSFDLIWSLDAADLDALDGRNG